MNKWKVLYFVSVAVILTTLLHGIKIIHVSGISMSPTLIDNTYGFSAKATDFELGDIVVADEDDLGYIIKRVIGVPGDRVIINKSGTYVNGVSVTKEFANPDNADDIDIVVPEDSLFLVGDNRGQSTDSRVFGAVPISRVKYKMLSTKTITKTEYNLMKLCVCVFVIFVIYGDKVFEKIFKRRRQ